MNNLKPEEIWRYFKEILEIPRLSKHEEKIIAYLEDFAKSQQLDFKKDSSGNCLITKPATKGYEDRETVILQSHIDMVGEKLPDIDHDFSKDPIEAVIKDGWVTAKGTTLGADDGIGIAASMAILASDRIEHGPLECLFTVDEETGMTGAFGLQEGFMKGKILLNLDSEDEGEIFIGCAGGIDTLGRFRKKTREVASRQVALKLSVEGLQGGHSGDEIHKGFYNGIKLLNRVLWNLDQQFKFRISSFSGGKLRNAIPREAAAVIVMKADTARELSAHLKKFTAQLNREVLPVEPNFKMTLEQADTPALSWKRSFQRKLMNMLYACPHGVIGWSRDISGLVETSTNMAVLRDENPEYIELLTSQRSSVDSAKQDIADRMGALFSLTGGEVKHSDGYPGWTPDTSSQILKISEKVYKDLFGTAPEVKAIHAGLECGLFLEKYPGLDMISFGPTIKGAHTPDEKIDIETVDKFWDFLLAILKEVPARK